MKYDVLIEDTGEHYACLDSESVLEGMARLGRRGIPLGCRGGGCGVCKVQVTGGEYSRQAMSRQHVDADDLQAGVVLACRISPCSDLCVRVVGKLEKAVCREPGA
ncbi:2Fe-2S iron-sulfur cluster-binding protein [Pseudothauera rhizosphaerae]|uniref:2Fe-2S iron-sulfur cluster binding domain-containing protein n=1 Tax=Pseudothauera rhizosphaerae TaxID=2565932 RepID=A0A4S4AAL5_9RHOO|nr:2Fe-2S iron-sulfur cluster-binding protein [Pseudothauera rhizosphaerae]THF55191.1 2Fe-2S iron-sulfur cluster binding domain-containing protein [Pseudothauera rhizosphaerae]